MNDNYKIVTVVFNTTYEIGEESFSKEDADKLCQELIDKTNYAGCSVFMEYYVIKEDKELNKAGLVSKIKSMLKGV